MAPHAKRRERTSERLRKVPVVSFEVLRPVTPMCIFGGLGFFDDGGACRSGALEVSVEVRDVDVERAVALTRVLRRLILRPRMPQHQHATVVLHGSVSYYAVLAGLSLAGLAEAESSREPVQGGGYILVVEVGFDARYASR
jgi:hypothetical protein